MTENPWKVIDRPSSDVNVRLADPSHPLEHFWGKDHGGGLLYIYRYEGLEVSGQKLPALEGFEICQYRDDATGTVRLVLRLADSSEWEIFKSLCEDLMASTRNSKPGRDATATILARLARWRAFLRRDSKELSDHERMGLIGELLFLEGHVAPRRGMAFAVDCWTGPLGNPQDFEMGVCAVEVKCKSGTENPRVRISNIDQLMPRLPTMYLHVVTLAKSDHGLTLPGLVEGIRKKILADCPELEDVFHTKLLAEGYVPLEAYKAYSYIKTSESFYHVVDGFPRILQDSVAAGVESLSYSISLQACEPFRVPHTPDFG